MVGGAIEIRNPPPDFDYALEKYHNAAAAFVKGNPEPYERVFSRREDVSIANPFAPFGPPCAVARRKLLRHSSAPRANSAMA